MIPVLAQLAQLSSQPVEFSTDFGMFPSALVYGPMLVVAVVHLGFAIAVAGDIGRLRQWNIAPVLVGTFLWFLATLMGGVFVATAYWLLNRSTLNPRNVPKPRE